MIDRKPLNAYGLKLAALFAHLLHIKNETLDEISLMPLCVSDRALQGATFMLPNPGQPDFDLMAAIKNICQSETELPPYLYACLDDEGAAVDVQTYIDEAMEFHVKLIVESRSLAEKIHAGRGRPNAFQSRFRKSDDDLFLSIGKRDELINKGKEHWDRLPALVQHLLLPTLMYFVFVNGAVVSMFIYANSSEYSLTNAKRLVKRNPEFSDTGNKASDMLDVVFSFPVFCEDPELLRLLLRNDYHQFYKAAASNLLSRMKMFWKAATDEQRTYMLNNVWAHERGVIQNSPLLCAVNRDYKGNSSMILWLWEQVTDVETKINIVRAFIEKKSTTIIGSREVNLIAVAIIYVLELEKDDTVFLALVSADNYRLIRAAANSVGSSCRDPMLEKFYALSTKDFDKLAKSDLLIFLLSSKTIHTKIFTKIINDAAAEIFYDISADNITGLLRLAEFHVFFDKTIIDPLVNYFAAALQLPELKQRSQALANFHDFLDKVNLPGDGPEEYLMLIIETILNVKPNEGIRSCHDRWKFVSNFFYGVKNPFDHSAAGSTIESHAITLHTALRNYCCRISPESSFDFSSVGS